MPRTANAQLNIRSRFARDRVAEISRATGMTAAQIVEDALRAYVPPGQPVPSEGLIRKGALLVLTGGPPMTLEETNAAIEAARLRLD